MEGLQGGTRATARRALKFAVLTVCAALGLALASGPALAKKPAKKPKAPKITFNTPVTPGSGYLALGDSVVFGYEEQQVVPAARLRGRLELHRLSRGCSAPSFT